MDLENSFLAGTAARNTGGGVHVWNATLNVENCTIVGNTPVAAGGGMFLYSRLTNTRAITNSVFANNAAPIGPAARVQNTDLTVAYSHLLGGADSVSLDDYATLNWGDGIIDLDPLFTDPDGPDDDPNTWADIDHSLAPGTPCIDAGDKY